MSASNTIVRNVQIARGFAADVKFFDQRESHMRIVAKCPSVSDENIVITKNVDTGWYLGTVAGVEVSKSRLSQVAFRRAVKRTWRAMVTH